MKKICVVTGNRAEYGLLRRVMKGIQDAPDMALQIIVTGSHLSQELGMTGDEIELDGFKPDATIEMVLAGDTPTAICKSMGLGMIGYGSEYQRLKPDIVVVLGDRYEIFCAAAAAHVCRIPLAHIHGGDTTAGAIDEAFRHSITKMSFLHFAGCEDSRCRIVQLGESPDRVFNVGSLSVENVRVMSLMERSKLAEAIGFGLERPYFLVTFHPVTLEKDTSEGQFQSLIDALDAFPEYNVIFTKANADTGGRIINRLIDEYARKQPGRYLAVASLGTLKYLTAMKYATAVVGNSSSGIIEAPSFRVPTINIGDRQKGRIQAPCIVNCPPTTDAIRQAIHYVLSPAFRVILLDVSNPYDRPDTASEIVRLLGNFNICNTIKAFHDIVRTEE